MAELKDRVRSHLQQRLLERGGARELADPELFEAVEGLLRRAVVESEQALLIPELLSDETEWRLETALRWSSHRRLLGRPILFLKRRALLPVTRWLYQYSQENFRRQQRVNTILFACLQALAIDNARLRGELKALKQ